MSTPCILVTGVGAIIGQGIIKSLRMADRPVRIIGLDRNPHAFGANLCDSFVSKPENEDNEEYLLFLTSLIKEYDINMIIPGIEHDIFFFDAHRNIFKQSQAFLVLNSHELIEIARDKWETAKILEKAGIQIIPGIIPSTWQECISKLGPPPLLLKPRQGNGSRGIVKLYDERDFEYWVANNSINFIIQKIVGTDNQEYTASVFGFGNGRSTSPIIFKRQLNQNGSTLSAELVQDSLINILINRLTKLFKPIGPTNYQFRKESEVVYLLEVNPRISSATSFRAAFNYNEAWMCIDYFIHEIHPNPQPAIKGRATRYTEDWIEYL